MRINQTSFVIENIHISTDYDFFFILFIISMHITYNYFQNREYLFQLNKWIYFQPTY